MPKHNCSGKKCTFTDEYLSDIKSHKVTLEGNYPNYNIYLDPLENNEHKYTIILLHGLGDSAIGFYQLINGTLNNFFN